MTPKELRDFLDGLIAEGTADSGLTDLRDILSKEVARGYGDEELDETTVFRISAKDVDRIFYSNRISREYPFKKDNVYKEAII